MGIPATYRKLYPRFKFRVHVDGFESAAFQKATGFKVTLGEMKYYEGGAMVPYKEPGLGEVGDITLERGVSKQIDFYSWILECINVMANLPGGIGRPSPQFFRQLVITQMDRDDSRAIDMVCHWAFPKDWTGGEWDNTSNEFTIESLVVAYHHPERKTM